MIFHSINSFCGIKLEFFFSVFEYGFAVAIYGICSTNHDLEVLCLFPKPLKKLTGGGGLNNDLPCLADTLHKDSWSHPQAHMQSEAGLRVCLSPWSLSISVCSVIRDGGRELTFFCVLFARTNKLKRRVKKSDTCRLASRHMNLTP